VFVALVSVAACGETLTPAPADDRDASTTPDAATTDGTSPSEDASSDVAACPTLSDDFNRADLAQGWTQLVDRGTATTDADGAFVSQTNAGAALDGREAVLSRDLAVVPKSLKCTFRMRLDTPAPNDNYVDAFSVALTAADGRVSHVRLGIEHGRISLREDLRDDNGTCISCPTKSPNDASASFQSGDFMTATFTTDFTDFSAKAGAFGVSGTFVGFAPKKVMIILGVVNFSTQAATRTFDDLVCELGC
jgi:hypothetical protein